MYRLLMGVVSQNKEKEPYYEMYIRSYLMLFMSQAVKKHRMESTPRAGYDGVSYHIVHNGALC